jgi:hypothetical protein
MRTLLSMAPRIAAALIAIGSCISCSSSPLGGGPDAGVGSRTDAGGGNDSAADAGSDATDQCAPFGLIFAPTCGAGCPTANLSCPCLIASLGGDLVDFSPCGQSRQCLLNVDCSTLCAKATGGWNAAATNGLLDDIATLQSCVSQRQAACNANSDCTGGVCVGDGVPGGGTCGPSSPGGLCYETSDCAAGKCTLPSTTAPASNSGLCTRGMHGEPCYRDGDCGTGLRCVVPAADAGAAGTCAAGQAGDPCGADADCQSRICSRHPPTTGTCLRGQVDDTCFEDHDCAVGLCSTDPSSMQNVCISGETGTLCYTDAQCQSGHCSLLQVAGRMAPAGLCENRDPGDPCSDGQDCKSGQCVGFAFDPTVQCQQGQSQGVQCGNGGVCSGPFCVQGWCDARPAPTGILLTPDANGRYDGSNAAGVVGTWWAASDDLGTDGTWGTGSCPTAGFPPTACSVLTTPAPGGLFTPDPNGRGMCASGVAAQVISDSTGTLAWSVIWGDIFGFSLNSPEGSGTMLGQYDAIAHGVTGLAFDIDAVPDGGHIRVGFQTLGTEYNPAYWFGATQDQSPIDVPGHYEVRWSEVGGPAYLANPPPFDPTQLEQVQFHVVSNSTAPIPFSFCLSNIMFLTK